VTTRNWQALFQQGEDLSPAMIAMLTSLEQDVASGGGGSVPDGGDTSDILQKLSSADGDADWSAPALPSNDTPVADSGAGTAGISTDFSRSDHVHPVPDLASQLDAYTVLAKTTPVTNDVYPLGPYAGSGVSMFGQGQGYPFRVSASATYKIGTKVTSAGGVGALIRFGVFNDDSTGLKAGTLLADLGTIDGTSTTLQYASGTVTLEEGTRYWIVVQEQGGSGTHPQIWSATAMFALGMTGGNLPANTARYAVSGAFASNPTLSTYDQAGVFALVFQVQ
jgi:hypothetical protein